jgi:hypothetical protein
MIITATPVKNVTTFRLFTSLHKFDRRIFLTFDTCVQPLVVHVQDVYEELGLGPEPSEEPVSICDI